MNHHKNERLTAYSRALLVKRITEEGLRPIEVAKAQGVSVRTVYKWLRRFREGGRYGLLNRSSRPCSCPHEYGQTVRQEVIRRRRERQTYRQISMALKVGKSTVARDLAQAGLNRLANLEPPRLINRYEHETPGDMLHLDIKKLGRFERPGHRMTGDRAENSRGAGWEYIHVAIDDHSRVARATVQEDETGMSASLPSLTRHGPMASLSASYKRRCGNGPMHGAITVRMSVAKHCKSGYTTITTGDHMLE